MSPIEDFLSASVAAQPPPEGTVVDGKSHKKKKQKGPSEGLQPDADATTPKSKKKRKRIGETQSEDPQGIVVGQLADPEGPPAKKKRRTKSSTKSALEPPTESSASDTANFLSAIVAAATGATEVNSVPTSHLQPDFSSEPQRLSQYHFVPPQYTQQSQSPRVTAEPVPFNTGPSNLPLSELAFGSNEDVLRALQDLDITKIANVLKTLGEAAAAANIPTINPQPNLVQPSFDQNITPLGQVPAASDTILGDPKEDNLRTHRRTLDMGFMGIDNHTSPDHAHLLANKWLSASKLSELVKSQGLVYKKGKFSAIEEQQLKAAIDNYRVQKQLSEEQMQEIIFPKVEKNRDNAFWSEITAAVPQRPIIAVYHHVRRSYHPMKLQGKWMPEEDAMLKQAVADLGQQWEKVSERVGRMSSDCRDRYRNHIINRDIRVTGVWSKEEEDELTRIVTQITVQQGRDLDNDVFWGKVSELMGGKRGRQQCRIKWTDALSKRVKNEGQKPRWSQQDAFILVHKIDSLNVRDDTEIDWKTLSDPHWNLWSAHTLQRRWLTMKRGIKGFEDMTHQEIMDILRIKKAHLPVMPPSGARKRKERRVTSAAAISESDLSTQT